MPESNMPMGRAARSRLSVEGLVMVAGRRCGAPVVSLTARGTVQTAPQAPGRRRCRRAGDAGNQAPPRPSDSSW